MMAYGKCPYASESCKYWDASPVIKGETNGCRTNEHHFFKQEVAKTLGKLAQEFCNLSVNRVNICQAAHEYYEAEHGWPEYPTSDIMREVVKK